jgi:hypothetical protein
MSKKLCAVLIAPIFLLASMASVAAMEGSELVAKLDTTAPKFNTEGCKSARDTMANYDGHVAERTLEGALMWAAFGGIFAIPGALSQAGQEERVANYLVQNLQTECGRQTIFPAYLDAANKGEAPAQAWVARSYESGDGAPREYAQAMLWYQKAADQGFSDAMVSLGNMYFMGEGAPSEPVRAVALWQKAANNGSVTAKANLGAAYFEGKGVQQDYSKAISLWQEAVKHLEPSAQAYLGKAYLEGKGIGQNVGEALRDFRTASWNGSGLAQYELGTLYETGIAVPRSDADAYRWYAVAEQNGFTDAAAKRQQLASRLTPDQIQKQDAAASTCFKSKFMNCP